MRYYDNGKYEIFTSQGNNFIVSEEDAIEIYNEFKEEIKRGIELPVFARFIEECETTAWNDGFESGSATLEPEGDTIGDYLEESSW